jgi:hypothetical protein
MFGLPSDFGTSSLNLKEKRPQFSVVVKPKNGAAVGSGAWPNAVVAMRTITTFFQVFKIENCRLDFPACRQGRFGSFCGNGEKNKGKKRFFASSYAKASADESLRNRRFDEVNDRKNVILREQSDRRI